MELRLITVCGVTIPDCFIPNFKKMMTSFSIPPLHLYSETADRTHVNSVRARWQELVLPATPVMTHICHDYYSSHYPNHLGKTKTNAL